LSTQNDVLSELILPFACHRRCLPYSVFDNAVCCLRFLQMLKFAVQILL